MDKKYRILIICAAILVLCFVGTASAKTWYVDDDGGADFRNIQDAVGAASDGDTIIVYSGTYMYVHVDKPLILIGKDTGSGKPVVDAGGYGSDSGFSLEADGITLEGFTVINQYTLFSAGILVVSSNNIIRGHFRKLKDSPKPKLAVLTRASV